MPDLKLLELRRLRQPATIASARSALVFQTGFESENIDSQPVDLSRFQSKIEELGRGGGGTFDTSTDAQLAQEIHAALNGLPRRVLTDPLMWQWLTLEVFPNYVRSRWFGDYELRQLRETDGAGKALIPDSAVKRFLGNASMVGVSRNALARLFWGAEAAWFQASGKDRYAEVDIVFASSDLFVGVFERVLGLREDTSLELIREIGALDQNVRRSILINLNLVLSTTCLEAMSLEDFEHLVHQLISLETDDAAS